MFGVKPAIFLNEVVKRSPNKEAIKKAITKIAQEIIEM